MQAIAVAPGFEDVAAVCQAVERSADEATALEALPKLPSAFDDPSPQTVILKATGTDPKHSENVLPSGLPEQAALDGISGHRMAISRCVEQALSHDAKMQETPGNPGVSAEIQAERVGFEPTMDLHPCRFSRPVQSAALPPLRSLKHQSLMTNSFVSPFGR